MGKNYIKARKTLEVQVKVNYGEVVRSNEEQLLSTISYALLETFHAVDSLNIKNFEIDKFYADLRKILTDRPWLSEKYVEKVFQYKESSDKIESNLIEFESMSEDSFWELIEGSKHASEGDLDEQIEIIVERLSKRSESEIIGFELTLREFIMKSYHYNVTALQKIVEGSVTDDSFLYFRCKIILYGRMTYENVVNNPDQLSEVIDASMDAEMLLMVANRAFTLKFGDDTDKTSPKDYASQIVDYDAVEASIQGKAWKESDLPSRYPMLWKMYR